MTVCRICKHTISSSRNRGADGTDDNGNPVPFWTDDPLYTYRGLAGDDYKGQTPLRPIHIIELQNYYSDLEEQYLTEEDRTPFLTVDRKEPGRHIYIEQLRISVEKILDAMGSNLTNYFQYDYLGNDTGLTQSDWTDVDRSVGYPRLPRGIPVRAIHVEELRRGISGVGYDTFFTNIYGLGNASREVDYFDNFYNMNVPTVDSFGPEAFYIYQNGHLHYFRYNYYKYCKTNNLYGLDYSEIAETLNWSERIAVEFNPSYGSLTGSGFKSLGIDTDGEEVTDGTDYIMYAIENFSERQTLDLAFGCDYIAKYTSVRERILGNSNGNANQTFDAASKGVYTPIYTDGEIVYVEDVAWTRVDDFSGSGSGSRHYTIDNESGVITFGDGVNGAIPTSGAEIKIFITLLGGGYWTYQGIEVAQSVNTRIEQIMVAPGKMWYTKREDCDSHFTGKVGSITSTIKGEYTTWELEDSPRSGEQWLYSYPEEESDNRDLTVVGNVSIEKDYGPHSLIDNAADAGNCYVVSENPGSFNFIFKKKEDFDILNDGVTISTQAGAAWLASNGQSWGSAEGFVIKVEASKWTGDPSHPLLNDGYYIKVWLSSNLPIKLVGATTGSAVIKFGDIEGSFDAPIFDDYTGQYQHTDGDIHWACQRNYFYKYNNVSHDGWIDLDTLLNEFVKVYTKSRVNGKYWGYSTYNHEWTTTVNATLITVES